MAYENGTTLALPMADEDDTDMAAGDIQNADNDSNNNADLDLDHKSPDPNELRNIMEENKKEDRGIINDI